MANDNRIKKELEKLMKDGELDEVRERAARVACEAKIFYDAFKQAGFTDAQANELLLTCAGISWNEQDLMGMEDEI
jgi:hypothetical protein